MYKTGMNSQTEKNSSKEMSPDTSTPSSTGVSIIILTKDAASHLDNILSSFFKVNTYQPVELIIIDHSDSDSSSPQITNNNSQLTTRDIVSKYISKGFVRKLKRKQNYSFAESCNLGASKARHSYLLFLNNNMIYASDILPVVMVNFEQLEQVGAVGIGRDDLLQDGKEDSYEQVKPKKIGALLCRRSIFEEASRKGLSQEGDDFDAFVRAVCKNQSRSIPCLTCSPDSTFQWRTLELDDGVETKVQACKDIMHNFKKKVYPELTKQCEAANLGYMQWREERSRWDPKVMIGTLYSGENELDACRKSVKKQKYKHIHHDIIEGLPKKEAMTTLYEKFLDSPHDILIKLDADMVMMDPEFAGRVVEVFRYAEDLILMQMAIKDYYTGGPIQGINAYSKKLSWSRNKQDELFTDKAFVPPKNRLVVWTAFVDAIIHAPLSSNFHSYHFGVHRALKACKAVEEQNLDRGREQFDYLEQTWNHYTIRKEKNLLMAALGAELAYRGKYAVSDLDYTNPGMRKDFEEWDTWKQSDLEHHVSELRQEKLDNIGLQKWRDKKITSGLSSKNYDVLFLLPHTKIFGGVNRFFELSMALKKLGVESAIALPDEISPTKKPNSYARPDYPSVMIIPFRKAFEKKWPVVVCGDYSSGLIQAMPFFNNGLSIFYILNGWQHRIYNIIQSKNIFPDIFIANSSYAAKHYAELSPHILPGGVNTNIFCNNSNTILKKEKYIVFSPSGRMVKRKRFQDAVDAVQLLIKNNYNVELHAMTGGTKPVNNHHVAQEHLNISANEVSNVMCQSDVILCPEEDAGWNNPAAEALACQRPLVCTPAGTTDFALHKKTAMVVEPRNPQGLADAVEYLLRNPDQAREMALAGYQKIQEFSWDNVARGFVSILDNARIDYKSRQSMNAKARNKLAKSLGTVLSN